ncbi:MFS transporter [Novosphingobium sp. BW1]|uniref:MFS transporter n=1 Tax=Novosphingobium sp. BW1 TaxID=2592621 RepID=UPI0011DEA964|nr:MFS transporter [Novosphingobium sp. BW1]TYC89676.1 MFS transporter [Novosphingobium sp. BW1]
MNRRDSSIPCEQAAPARIGPIVLAQGVPVREVFVFLFITGIAVMVSAFINLMQPYVFSEMIGVAPERQGRLAGQLMTVQQAVVLVCVSFAGALADKIGRKALLVFALTGYSLAAVAYPLAGGVVTLFIIRFFFGIASSTHTASGPPKFYDYVDNGSRGKFMALVMIFYGLINILMVGVIGGALPGWLNAAGYDVAQAGTFALWLCGAVGFGAAIITALFLLPDRPAGPPPGSVRAPLMARATSGFRDLTRNFGRIVGYTRTNRRFGVLLLTSFVVRTDEAVVGSFFALWITLRGAQEGVSTTEALAIAGTVVALMRVSSFVVPPILGPILDKVDRLFIYILSLVLVGAAFLCAPLVDSVTGWEIFILALFIGHAESTQTIAQQALFGEEAPADLRGTAYGLLAFFGTVSVVVVSFVAGYLFDIIGLTAPFVMIGVLHMIFSVVALAYLGVCRRRGGAETGLEDGAASVGVSG